MKVDWRRQASGCAPRDAPFVFRVGIYAGWVSAWARVFSNRSTGPLTWFFHHPSQEFAEQLVAELNEQRKLDYTVHAVAHELQPRFGLIDVAGISTPQRASIKRAINAIKTGGPPLVVYSDYASAVATRAMKVAEELAEAWEAHQPPEAKPQWNQESHQLWYMGAMIRKVRPIAKNLIRILDTFEDDGWPRHIDDPLDPALETRRLSETLRTLNDGLKMIRFRADGTGEGIIWGPTGSD